MTTCDMCGKTSLFPETIGNATVCKMCFIKLNGPFWKLRPYDRYEDAEKQREKTIELVKSMNCPDSIITGVNTFFDSVTMRMNVCDVCGDSVQSLTSIGEAKLCKKCFRKINTNEWKMEEYTTNEEVEENRSKILIIAMNNNFPNNVIVEINKYFDSKIQKGLVTSVNGGYKQVLKIYETYCDLYTKENFDEEEVSRIYAKLLKRTKGGGMISNSMARSLMGSVLRGGGIVKAGMDLATNFAIESAVDMMVPQREALSIVPGHQKIDYLKCESIEYQKVVEIGEEYMGYIKFNCKSAVKEHIFFFKSDKKVRGVYESLNNLIEKARTKEENKKYKANSSSNISIADELLKFKSLLDMGVITEEEFKKKKDELLNS